MMMWLDPHVPASSPFPQPVILVLFATHRALCRVNERKIQDYFRCVVAKQTVL